MNPFVRFLVKRLGALTATLIVASVAVYGAMYLAPGDPAALIAGGHLPNPAQLARIRAEHHLDDPFVVQYWRWLTAVLHGDLGTSLVLKAPVAALIGPRLLTTLLLVAYAALIIIVVGVLLGAASAVLGGVVDGLVSVVTTVLMAAPAFVSAIVLIWVFSTRLSWFPVFGTGTGLGDRIHHLTLPALALSAGWVAFLSRITRSEVRTALTADHVQAARGRGVRPFAVLRRHVLRNSAPAVLAVSGLTVAGVFAGTAVAEQAFGVNGLGLLLVQSAARQDIVVVQAISLLLVAAFVVVNTLVDVAHAVLDPRVLAGREQNA